MGQDDPEQIAYELCYDERTIRRKLEKFGEETPVMSASQMI